MLQSGQSVWHAVCPSSSISPASPSQGLVHGQAVAPGLWGALVLDRSIYLFVIHENTEQIPQLTELLAEKINYVEHLQTAL